MKYTIDEVKNVFIEKDYEPLFNIYNNVSEKLPYICNKHKKEGIQYISFSKLNSNRGCKYCGRERTIIGRRNLVSEEQCISLCKLHNFIYVDKVYKDKALVIKFICQNHIELGIQEMKYQNMKRDLKGCQYCSGKNLPEWYVFQLIEDVNPNVEILDSYINLTTRMKCRCKIHNVYSNKTVQEILDGKGCIECGKEKLSNYHMFSQKEFEERSLQNNPHIKIRGKYRGNKEKLEVECKKCHNIWNQTAVTLMYGFKLCPFCNGYYGEIAVANFLTGFGFTYEQQYKFEDCKDKRMLPFDFGIKDINGKLICLIEYDGLQHFEPVVVMNMPEERKYEAYEKTVKHDKIKNNYCTQHNIPLIRVPYWEYDNGTLEHFLFDELVKLNLIEEIN